MASTSAAPSGSAAAPAGAAGGIPTKEASPSLAAEGAPLPADADPEQVLIAADRAATSARYVHVDGWVDHQGRKVTVDADLTSAPAAAGWISEGGDKVLVRYVGGNVYARGSSALYEKYLGQRAARRVGDRWLMVPASGREYQQVTGLASPGGLLTELFPDAAGALMRMLLSRVCDPEPARVTSRLPFDEALSEALVAAQVPHERLEMYQAMASNMILVVNLEATLRAIAPELSRRLAGSLVPGWEDALELALPAEHCVLTIAGGEVRVAEAPGGHDLRLELTQAQFVKALLGIAGLTEMSPARAASLSPTLRGLLDALFPRLQAGSGPWG